MASPLTDLASMQLRIKRLTGFLAQHRPLWEERPFVQESPSWRATWPDLAKWLCALDEATVDAVESETLDLASIAIDPLRAWIAQADALTGTGPLPTRRLRAMPEDTGRRVKERKWAQISALVGVASNARPESTDRWLDWCGGKGHVGRLAALQTGLPVTHLERQKPLCDAGAALDRRDGVQGSFVCADAMGPGADEVVGEGVAAIGLHACGSLGERLLTLCHGRGATSVVLAPCCHHVIADRGDYQPLSASAQAHDLGLSRWNLRLATSDEVIASPARRRQRRLVVQRRLAADILMRRLTGDDRYHSPGKLPPGLLTGPLAEVCAEVARRRDVAIPADVDWQALQIEGERRAHVARALGLVRGVFRRSLELWVDLDRACYLAERGWQVQLGTFCERALTPRNLAIVAWRGDAAADGTT